MAKVAAAGTIDVKLIEIGGQLVCDGATFDGNGGDALNVQGAKVTSDVFLREVAATGTVNVSSTEIGGQIVFLGATFSAGDNPNAVALIGSSFSAKTEYVWREMKGVKGRVILDSAHAGILADDMASWPVEPGSLSLNGFTFDRIAGSSEIRAAARLKWLELGSHSFERFHPQPYGHLAKVLRDMGHNGEARTVLVERGRLLARQRRADRRAAPGYGGRSLAVLLHPLDWLWDRLCRIVAGYGFRPGRSLAAMLVLFLLASGVAWTVWNEGSFAPNSDVILTSAAWQEVAAAGCIPEPSPRCDPNPADTWSGTIKGGLDWDSFNALSYGADLVVPILDLGQTDAWAPSKDRGDWGWGLWWGRWAFAALGWLVTALGVAAITGVMQRGNPGD